jgi:hypothetical protein
MGKHQIRLLLCAAAAVALMVGALFVVDWFTIDFGLARINIDLRSAQMCMPEEGCRGISLSRMTGFYPIVAATAFWCSLPLLLILLVQTFGKLLTGNASAPIGKIGVSFGGLVFFCAFLAGYLFGPEPEALFQMAGITVSRTFAAPMLLGGSMLAMLAIRYAQLDGSDDGGEYKPVVVNKDAGDARIPVTPIHVNPVATTGHVLTPPGQSQRIPPPTGQSQHVGQSQRIPTPAGQRERIHTPAGGSERLVRIPPPGSAERGARIPTPGPMERVTPGARDRIPTPGPIERVTIPAARERILTPGGSEPIGQRERIPTPGPIERIPIPVARERIVTPSGGEPLRERAPDSLPFDANVPEMELDNPDRSDTASGPGGRTKTPSQPPDADRTKTPSQPPAVARTMSPSGRLRTPSEPPQGSGTSLRQPASERTKSPSQPGDRARTPSQPPAVSRTSSPQQPLVARTVSPQDVRTKSSQPRLGDDEFHTESPSERDLLRARMAAAPVAVAIKPPLPEPVPVPPDQIPVAPESGLVIRKRSQSQGPLASSSQGPLAAAQPTAQQPPLAASPAPLQLPLGSTPAQPVPRGSTPSQPMLGSSEQIPIAPDTGLTIRKKTLSSDPISTIEPASQSGRVQKIEPVTPSGRIPTASMPSVALRSLSDDIDQLEPAQIGSASPLAIPSVDDEAAASLALTEEPAKPRRATIHGQPNEAKVPAKVEDNTIPLPLRGKLRYAVVNATLTSAGIQALREDGTKQLVEWETIVGIIARRLPTEAPYNGSTFVDLVSVAGATLRILPWTAIAGAPVYGEDAERARVFVQLVAAHCLDAKLDRWTKVFADGASNAAQLANSTLLAEHDDRLA